MISWKEKFEDLLYLIFKKYIYNSEAKYYAGNKNN